MKLWSRLRRFFILLSCLARAIFFGRAIKLPNDLSAIIVVPTGKLGDIICTTPVLSAIRNKWPQVKIIAAGDSSSQLAILADSGLVDEYLNLKERGAIIRIRQISAQVGIVTGPSFEPTATLYLAGIPLVIAPIVVGGVSPNETRLYKILQKFIKTFPYHFTGYAPRERLRSLEPLGLFTQETKKHLGYSPVAAKQIKNFFDSIPKTKPGQELLIAISPSAGNKIKEWPSERFAAVADHLFRKYQATIFIVGSQADYSQAEELIKRLSSGTIVKNIVGRFNLDELKAFIARLDLFISVDTGPIYIAEAFAIPTIDIVGPVDDRVQPPCSSSQRCVVPPRRDRAELFILNARAYNHSEALRQTLSITVPMVLREIDDLLVFTKINKK